MSGQTAPCETLPSPTPNPPDPSGCLFPFLMGMGNSFVSELPMILCFPPKEAPPSCGIFGPPPLVFFAGKLALASSTAWCLPASSSSPETNGRAGRSLARSNSGLPATWTGTSIRTSTNKVTSPPRSSQVFSALGLWIVDVSVSYHRRFLFVFFF
ncbi:hypothetical protein LZ32DRAFT_104861 [Colletotrichum eremochloae]|nr:hypothetical protein LZ32DRAFT_104861 [Colletotrichum eremochloae]